MNDSVSRAIRALIREELEATKHLQVRPTPAPKPVIEIPLRPGEVERHYPVAEVARLLGMSEDWVYNRLKDGTFVTANFGAGKSKRRIPASSINAFIEAHTFTN